MYADFFPKMQMKRNHAIFGRNTFLNFVGAKSNAFFKANLSLNKQFEQLMN